MIDFTKIKHYYYVGNKELFKAGASYIYLFFEDLGCKLKDAAVFITSNSSKKLRLLIWLPNQFIEVKKEYKDRLFPSSFEKKIRVLTMMQATAIWAGKYHQKKH